MLKCFGDMRERGRTYFGSNTFFFYYLGYGWLPVFFCQKQFKKT